MRVVESNDLFSCEEMNRPARNLILLLACLLECIPSLPLEGS